MCKHPCFYLKINSFYFLIELHGKQLHQEVWVLLHLALEFRTCQVPLLLCNYLHHHLLSGNDLFMLFRFILMVRFTSGFYFIAFIEFHSAC